jgi:ATP-dependent DNA helicase RecQ
VREFIRGHEGQPGIVYRGTRKAVEKTALYLAGHGVRAVAYHAGIDDEDRRRRQEAFVRDEATVVVATIAFGMGIDKSNVRWVVHGDLPRSVEGYYQETGRAARDGDDADTVLFYGPADIASIRWQIGQIEASEERARAEARLQEILRYVGAQVCRRIQLLAHFGEHHPGNCGRCDVCTGQTVREDMTVAAMKVLSAAARTGERFGAHHLADILVGNATDRIMERGHHALPTFGIGRDRDKAWWLSLIQELEAGDFLLRGEGRLAGFHLSDRGRLLLRGKESFFAAGAGSAAVADEPPAPALPAASPDELFLCLKQLRKRIAESRDIPPYIVFSDKTLRAMAKDQPMDPAGFLRCPGVGDRKLAAYGGDFLKAIRSFRDTGECGE